MPFEREASSLARIFARKSQYLSADLLQRSVCELCSLDGPGLGDFVEEQFGGLDQGVGMEPSLHWGVMKKIQDRQ